MIRTIQSALEMARDGGCSGRVRPAFRGAGSGAGNKAGRITLDIRFAGLHGWRVLDRLISGPATRTSGANHHEWDEEHRGRVDQGALGYLVKS